MYFRDVENTLRSFIKCGVHSLVYSLLHFKVDSNAHLIEENQSIKIEVSCAQSNCNTPKKERVAISPSTLP